MIILLWRHISNIDLATALSFIRIVRSFQFSSTSLLTIKTYVCKWSQWTLKMSTREKWWLLEVNKIYYFVRQGGPDGTMCMNLFMLFMLLVFLSCVSVKFISLSLVLLEPLLQNQASTSWRNGPCMTVVPMLAWPNEGESADFFSSRWLYLSQFLMAGNSIFYKFSLKI